MKTMTDIVESIKNEELRAFATKLQRKLEQARTATVSKKKKVSGAEQSALRNSVSKFTEKNRGKLPQKVAGLLALTMLATMLASCDEFGKPGHGRPHDTKEPTIEDTVEPEIPQYEHLEIEEFTGEPLDPRDCGLRAFDYFDFTNNFTGGSFGKQLKKEYDYYMSDKYEHKGYDKDMYACVALLGLSGYNGKSENIEIDISYTFHSDWTHRLISTQTDLALVSKAPNGNTYVTGFVDGKLINSAGLINEASITTLTKLSHHTSYNEILEYSRKELFGQMFKLVQDDKLLFGQMLDCIDEEGNYLPNSEVGVRIYKIVFNHENGGTLAEAEVNEGISEDYILTLFDAGWSEDETKKQPSPIPEDTKELPTIPENPDAIPPHYKEDYTEDNNYYDEEETTTGASDETEAEIDPE